MNESVKIDICSLKNQHDKNSLQHYIWSIALHCKENSRAHWDLETLLKIKSRLISIPLLILTSATSLTSIALQQSYSEMASAAVIAMGVASAGLVAFQKLTRYSERAEGSKHIAKAYMRLGRRIETKMVLVESNAVFMEPASFLSFVKQVEKELNVIINDTEDMPEAILKRRFQDGGFGFEAKNDCDNNNNNSNNNNTRIDQGVHVHAMFRQIELNECD